MRLVVHARSFILGPRCRVGGGLEEAEAKPLDHRRHAIGACHRIVRRKLQGSQIRLRVMRTDPVYDAHPRLEVRSTQWHKVLLCPTPRSKALSR